ncbi:hypothetical protein [Streptomyces massasporeus]
MGDGLAAQAAWNKAVADTHASYRPSPHRLVPGRAEAPVRA